MTAQTPWTGIHTTNMKHLNTILALGLLFVAIFAGGCSPAAIEDVPPGYIGKILTPTGWKDGVYEAGQVDIGQLDAERRGNRLINCEASSVTVKESFSGPSEANGNEDHRIVTQKKVPLAVDLYVQVAVPDDPKTRDSIFAQVTPRPSKNDERVSWIYLQDIYNQFAQMDIRGKTRQIFTSYKDYDDVMAHYDDVNKKISAMIIDTFKQSKVPLKLISGQISNVKADATVWEAENKRAAATAEVDTINAIGKAIRENPGYLEKYKWDQLKDMAGKGVTVIVNDGGANKPIGINIPK